jgi:hypothetical protein
MKRTLFILIAATCLSAFTFINANAQTDTTDAHAVVIDTNITMDLLVAPNSPGFTLLGISPDNVDRPETPADFAASIANTTNNLSALPKNYAMEFLPFSLLSNSFKSFQDFKAPKTLSTILQTFTVSTAFATDDEVETSAPGYIRTQTGIGIRFSILNGTIDSADTAYNSKLADIRTALIQLHDQNSLMMRDFRATDSGYINLDNQIRNLALQDSILTKDQYIPLRIHLTALGNFRNNADSSAKALSIQIQMDSLKDIFADNKRKIAGLNPLLEDYIEAYKVRALKVKTDEAKNLKKIIQETKFKRTGWMLDFAGGMVLGYRNDDFQNSIVQKAGAWLNGGYEDKSFNMLAVARYMTAFNSAVDSEGKLKNQSNFDAGLKLEMDALDKKFTLSIESISRFLKDTVVYRYTINASYQVGTNQALTFSLGRDFAGSKQSGGNLIAALNFVKAFGTKRTVANAH